MKSTLIALPILATLFGCSSMHDIPNASKADAFDRSLLSGLWAESVNTGLACEKDNLHNYFDLSSDGRKLVFRLDRKWKIASGQVVEAYTATVVRSSPRTLVIRYDSDSGDSYPTGYPVEWELAFVAPGIYRWRATDWPEGKVNVVVGIRCSP